MTEKELIAKIRQLRQIKPRENWVLLTKKELFIRGRTSDKFSFREVLEGMRIVFNHRYAFSSLVLLLVILGVFGFAQNSLPGDSLYSIKRIAEKSQAVFFSEKGQIIHNLDLANRRLDDLTKVVEQNSARNLGPAINEFQASVSKAIKSLTQAENNPKAVKEIAFEVKKIEEKTEKVKSLGVEIGETGQLQKVLSQLVEEQIKDLESRTFTQEEQEILAQAKESFQVGDYSQALEKILLLSQ